MSDEASKMRAAIRAKLEAVFDGGEFTVHGNPNEGFCVCFNHASMNVRQDIAERLAKPE